MIDTREWYYVNNNEKIGPISYKAISLLASTNQISNNTLVWAIGIEDWENANKHFSFKNEEPPLLPDTKGIISLDSELNLNSKQLLNFEQLEAAPYLDFFESIQQCFIKYVDFKSKASRSEFFYFFTFCNVIIFATMFYDSYMRLFNLFHTPYLFAFSFMALIIPSFAVTTRRLNDTGQSGWWIVSGIILFFVSLFCFVRILIFDDNLIVIATLTGFALIINNLFMIYFIFKKGKKT